MSASPPRLARLLSCSAFAACVSVGLFAGAALAASGWELKTTSGSIKIYNRSKEGSDLKELKAEGIIEAPPHACFNVVNDEGRYKEFMPYTADSKVIRKNADGSKIVYQRLDTPFVSDRDYTMIITGKIVRNEKGEVVYRKNWSSANHLGPAAIDGVVRVKTNEGHWLFEPLDGGKRTRATYYLFTDPGGALPSFIINAANGKAVPGVFEAVEKQASDPRYQKMPELPAEAPSPPPATVAPN